MPISNETSSFLDACRNLLDQLWTSSLSDGIASAEGLTVELIANIKACINSRTKTYRYVLPTQILAILVDPQLDCRIVQAGVGTSGAFDARSLASKVISPFDLANERVLGGTTDPYVNNPLRIPAVIPEQRSAQKDKEGFLKLCAVLKAVEDANSPEFTNIVYLNILQAIRDRLETVQVTYPFPNRISLDDTLRITESFLETRSGGDRFQTLLAALFEQIGASFKLYASVRRSKTNTADASRGSLADIECVDAEGRIVIAAEAKDRKITVAQLEEKIPLWRSAGLSEGFFISPETIRESDAERIEEIRRVQFRSGYNIYCVSWNAFSTSVFALIGETGRSDYLKKVAKQLDEFSSVDHRRAWAELLRTA